MLLPDASAACVLLLHLAALVNPNSRRPDFAVDNCAGAATMFVNMPELEGLMLHRSSEAELVRAVIAGDKTAYGLLYDRLGPLVRAVCYDYT